MEKTKQKITISKNYERKVNLSVIGNKFDNISIGSFVSTVVEVDGDEQLAAEMEKLTSLVVSETERDIKTAIEMLKKMDEDQKNQALVGSGDTLEISNEEVKEKKKNVSKRAKATKATKATKAKKETKKESREKSIEDFFGTGEMEISKDDMETHISVPDLATKGQLDLEEVNLDDFDPEAYGDGELL